MSEETTGTGTLFDRIAECEAAIARIWAALATMRGTLATPESEDGPVTFAPGEPNAPPHGEPNV